jgi:hypothetical protein
MQEYSRGGRGSAYRAAEYSDVLSDQCWMLMEA